MGINNNKTCIRPRRGCEHLVRATGKTSALRPPPREMPLKRNHNRKQIKVNAVENARRFGCRGRTGEIQKGIAARQRFALLSVFRPGFTGRRGSGARALESLRRRGMYCLHLHEMPLHQLPSPTIAVSLRFPGKIGINVTRTHFATFCCISTS